MSKEFTKSKWTVDGDTVRVGMEISKVDKRRRMVSGWATVDNVDQEGDQVTSEASIDAFSRSRLNLREMHKKDSAVGRIVSFKEDTFRAPDGQVHKGIFVKVYVSKGAEDTWQKVLDKTLNGFSIGGEVVETKEIMSKSGGGTINQVLKYNLNELSLVDNPGNEYSDFTNIFKIRKSADGSVTSVTGMIEEFKMLNVYYCDEDGITKEVPDDSIECPACGNEMEYVGSVEDDADIDNNVNETVQKFISTEGGAHMTKAKKKDAEETPEVTPAGPTDAEPEQPDEIAEDEDIEAGTDVVTTNVPAVDEVQDEGNEISKKIDGLKDDIEIILKNNNTKTSEKIQELEKSIKETQSFLEGKVNELDEKIATFNTGLETTKVRLSKYENLLEKLNKGTALRKSADSTTKESEEEQDNSGWNGAFSVRNLIG